MKRAKHNNFLFYNGKFIQAFSPPFITEETLQLNAFICTQVTYKLFFLIPWVFTVCFFLTILYFVLLCSPIKQSDTESELTLSGVRKDWQRIHFILHRSAKSKQEMCSSKETSSLTPDSRLSNCCELYN